MSDFNFSKGDKIKWGLYDLYTGLFSAGDIDLVMILLKGSDEW